MYLPVDVQNALSDVNMNSVVEDKVARALARNRDKIARVSVRLRQESTNGSPLRACALEVQLVPRGIVRASSRNENVYAAVAAALDAVQAGMRRHRNRNVDKRRKNYRATKRAEPLTENGSINGEPHDDDQTLML